MKNISYYTFAIKACHYLKCTGYGAFTVENGRVYVKPSDWFWFLLNLTLGIAALFISIATLNFHSTNKSIIIVYGNLLTINGVILIGLYSLITSFMLRRYILHNSVIFNNIDLEVKKFGVEVDLTKSFIFIGVAVSASILLVILSIVMYFLGESTTLILLTLHSGIQLSLGIGMISSFLAVVLARLLFLNDCLR